MAKNNRKSPEVNSGSMADVAFLLLIFFLVTTTIDTDKGISIRLPPITPKDQQVEAKIKERNVFTVLINSKDFLMVEDKPMDIRDLKKNAKEFIDNANRANDPNLAEAPGDAVISLKNDRGTSYNMYIQSQNELKAAYNELRDEMAMRKYGRKLADLSDGKQKEITDYYKQIISEAEPENVGGN